MSERVPHEVALAGFYKAQEQAVKELPLYDQCVAIYRAMRAAEDPYVLERKRRAAGPSSVKWPMQDPLAKYKERPSTPSPSHAETVAPYAAALRMIRDAVGELFGPVSDLESEDAVLLRGPEPHHEAEAIIAGLQRVKVENGRLEKSLQEAHEISERYREMYATKSNEKVEEFHRADAAEAILRSIADRPALMNSLDIETASAIHSALHPEREG